MKKIKVMQCVNFVITEGQMRDRINMAHMRWVINGKYWSNRAKNDPKMGKVPIYLHRLLVNYREQQKTCPTLEAHYNLMLAVDETIRNYLFEVCPPVKSHIREMSRWRE